MAVTNFKFTKIDNIIEIFDTFVPALIFKPHRHNRHIELSELKIYVSYVPMC